MLKEESITTNLDGLVSMWDFGRHPLRFPGVHILEDDLRLSQRHVQLK